MRREKKRLKDFLTRKATTCGADARDQNKKGGGARKEREFGQGPFLKIWGTSNRGWSREVKDIRA